MQTSMVLLCIGLIEAVVAIPYIIKGQDASPGQFPYTAKLMVGEKFHSTGTILSDRWIVTSFRDLGHVSMTDCHISLTAFKILINFTEMETLLQ